MIGLRNHSLEEAAEILGCRPRHLEDNLSRYEHQKIGAAVAFSDEQILKIKDACTVAPAPRAEPSPTVPGLRDISPSRTSRRRTS